MTVYFIFYSDAYLPAVTAALCTIFVIEEAEKFVYVAVIVDYSAVSFSSLLSSDAWHSNSCKPPNYDFLLAANK